MRPLCIGESKIAGAVGSPGHTLTRLLDEFPWLANTVGHQIP
jgi:hypothetical protein